MQCESHAFLEGLSQTLSSVSGDCKDSSEVKVLSSFVQNDASVTVSGLNDDCRDIPIQVEIISTATPQLMPVESNLDVLPINITYTGAGDEKCVASLIRESVIAQKATLAISGTVYQSLNTGLQGNAISVSVDRSNLAFTPDTVFVAETISAGSEVVPASLNLGGGISSDQSPPEDSFYFALKSDPGTVYAQYTVNTGSGLEYRISPSLKSDLLTNEEILSVTGFVEVTVTRGSEVEVYSPIFTEKDLHDQVLLSSQLIVPSSPNNSYDALPIVSEAFLGSVSFLKEGAEKEITGIDVLPGATKSAYSISKSVIGGVVSFTVASDLGVTSSLSSGDVYSDTNISFLLATELSDDVFQVDSSGNAASVNYASRPNGSFSIDICVNPIVSGLINSDKKIKWTYTRRPDGGVNCMNPIPRGAIDYESLGLQQPNTVRPIAKWVAEHKAGLLKKHADQAIYGVEFGGSDYESIQQTIVEIYDIIQAGLVLATGDVQSEISIKSVSDNLIISRFVNVNDFLGLAQNERDEHVRRVQCEVNQALISSGIYPVSVTDDPTVWVDHGDAFWWVPDDPAYMPAFSNAYYHSSNSSTMQRNGDFAMLIRVDGAAIEGDSVTTCINRGVADVQSGSGKIAIISVSPPPRLNFTGGVDEDKTELWQLDCGGIIQNFTYNT